jgi:hypothetical protein
MSTLAANPSRRKLNNELSGAVEVKRSIPVPVQCMLWGRAAGRCEFAGCNKALWKSSVTQEQVNTAQKAHIYSFSAGGPRGNRGIAEEDLNCLANLLLVCHECHQKIDDKRDGGRYTVSLLKQMKFEHEQRIEQTTGIITSKRSHILMYGANIGDHSSPLKYDDAASALFPARYPASDTPVNLMTVNSSLVERDSEYWLVEAKALRRKFNQRVRERIAIGDIDHVSVFAVAPQALLILLGTLLGDIVPADVYQRHREPPTWCWPATASPAVFEVHKPSCTGGPPALVVALSATVMRDRVTTVLGSDAAIWTVTTPIPHNDLIKSREHLAQLRSLFRVLFDQIKAIYGAGLPLHIFPACAVSTAIELGRVRMPKADMPWEVYDENTSRGGFAPALTINNGDQQ